MTSLILEKESESHCEEEGKKQSDIGKNLEIIKVVKSDFLNYAKTIHQFFS